MTKKNMNQECTPAWKAEDTSKEYQNYLQNI